MWERERGGVKKDRRKGKEEGERKQGTESSVYVMYVYVCMYMYVDGYPWRRLTIKMN